jgi:hypothetical protein
MTDALIVAIMCVCVFMCTCTYEHRCAHSGKTEKNQVACAALTRVCCQSQLAVSEEFASFMSDNILTPQKVCMMCYYTPFCACVHQNVPSPVHILSLNKEEM